MSPFCWEIHDEIEIETTGMTIAVLAWQPYTMQSGIVDYLAIHDNMFGTKSYAVPGREAVCDILGGRSPGISGLRCVKRCTSVQRHIPGCSLPCDDYLHVWLKLV